MNSGSSPTSTAPGTPFRIEWLTSNAPIDGSHPPHDSNLSAQQSPTEQQSSSQKQPLVERPQDPAHEPPVPQMIELRTSAWLPPLTRRPTAFPAIVLLIIAEEEFQCTTTPTAPLFATV